MTPDRGRAKQFGFTVTIGVVIIGAWTTTVWLAWDVRAWAIEWTNVAFTATLFITYFGLWALAMLWARDRRIMVFRAVTCSIVLVVVALIMEMGAITGFVNYDLVYRWLRNETGFAAAFVEDKELGYRRPPNMQWSGIARSDMAETWNLPMHSSRPLQFSTDSAGFRNSRDMSEAEIVLIGDSYIEGHYVSDSETVAVRLEELTGRAVANLGQSGYGSLQELIVLEEYGLPLKPKLVAWFFFEGNDLYNDQEFENLREYFSEPTVTTPDDAESQRPRSHVLDWEDFWKASFVRNTFRQVRRSVHAVLPQGVATFGWFADERGEEQRLYFYDYALLRFTDYEAERLRSTEETLVSASQACRENNARLVVFFVPMKFRVYGELCRFPSYSPCAEWTPWDLDDRMAALCGENGIEFVDLTEPMKRAAEDRRLLYTPEDSHWNPAGHRFVAGQVAAIWKNSEGAGESEGQSVAGGAGTKRSAM